MSYHIHIKFIPGNLKAIYAIKHVRQHFGYGLKDAKDIIDRARTADGIRLEDTKYWDDVQLRKFQAEMLEFGFGVELVPAPDSEEDFKWRNVKPEEKDETKMSLREVMIYRMEHRQYASDEYAVQCRHRTVQDILDDPFPRTKLNALSNLALLDEYTKSSSAMSVPFC